MKKPIFETMDNSRIYTQRNIHASDFSTSMRIDKWLNAVEDFMDYIPLDDMEVEK